MFRKGYRIVIYCFFAALLIATFTFEPATAQASEESLHSASVILYHRFGEDRYPSTSISMKQFEAHLEELKTGGYTVVSLETVVAGSRGLATLPDKAVALTVDDAYRSVFVEAWPRLKALGYPLTVFVATDPIDLGLRGYMSWDQLRQLRDEGVTIGNHTASHLRMANSASDINRADIEKAQARFKQELGFAPDLFAYPYGEASLAVTELVKTLGFKAAFGQHSGAIGSSEPLFYLPRFAMNEQYGNKDRFKMVASTISLPYRDFSPEDPLIQANQNPPAIGFTLGEKLNPENLNCFISHQKGPVELEKPGGGKVTVSIREPMPIGHTRFNCTKPGPDGRWYWLGRQFYRAN